jgi:hypothetical protein
MAPDVGRGEGTPESRGIASAQILFALAEVLSICLRGPVAVGIQAYDPNVNCCIQLLLPGIG